MAAPLAKFRTKMFVTSLELYAYVTDTASDVNTITSIVFDASSAKYVLFYMIA